MPLAIASCANPAPVSCAASIPPVFKASTNLFVSTGASGVFFKNLNTRKGFISSVKPTKALPVSAANSCIGVISLPCAFAISCKSTS